ncbi:hypothetical protein, partial [Cobetia sp. MC34]|uniref:hypothetical protein n=1 Tax=Cobetia sp. MC34 TaxID=2785080 RepID=UPI001BC91294
HGTVVRFTGTTRTVLSSIGQAPAAEVSGQEKCQSVLTDWHYAHQRPFLYALSNAKDLHASFVVLKTLCQQTSMRLVDCWHDAP